MQSISFILGIALASLGFIVVAKIADFYINKLLNEDSNGGTTKTSRKAKTSKQRNPTSPSETAKVTFSKGFFSKNSTEDSSEKITEPDSPELVTYTNRVVRKGLVPINWSGIELEPYELTFKESSNGEKHFNFIACYYKSHTAIQGIDGTYIKATRVTFTNEEQGNGRYSIVYNAGTPDYSTHSGDLNGAPDALREAFTELMEVNGFKGLN